MRCVVVHPQWGVYMGHALGLGFFSMLDCAGQPGAVTFKDRTDAEEHIRGWQQPNEGVESFTFHDVVCENEGCATPDELQAADIPLKMIEPIRAEIEAMRQIEADQAAAMRPH